MMDGGLGVGRTVGSDSSLFSIGPYLDTLDDIVDANIELNENSDTIFVQSDIVLV